MTMTVTTMMAWMRQIRNPTHNSSNNNRLDGVVNL
jgi:hypothetical protein